MRASWRGRRRPTTRSPSGSTRGLAPRERTGSTTTCPSSPAKVELVRVALGVAVFLVAALAWTGSAMAADRDSDKLSDDLEARVAPLAATDKANVIVVM